MMRNHLRCSALVLLSLLGLRGALATQCGWGKVLTSEGCVCLQCPVGQEPSKACGQAEGPEEVVRCQACSAGTFSDTYDSDLCRPHTSCAALNRLLMSPGSTERDATCGDCMPGFYSAAKEKSSSPDSCVRLIPRPLVRVLRNVGKGVARGTGRGPANATNVRSAEEKNTEYAVFALVPIFCVMGLLGILICNILKKKGYHCTAEKEGGDEEAPTPQKEGNSGPYIVDDPNEDTISVLVRLITEKKENAAALEELLLEYESKQMSISKASSIKFPVLPHLPHQFRSLPRLCPHQHHLHTINGLAPRAGNGSCCSRCSQKKWPELLLPPIDTHKTTTVGGKNPLPGEVTILSVGRFQVAQIPEQKALPAELTPPESSDTDSVDTSHTEAADEKSLLGVSSLSSSSTWTKSKQEVNS
ncbi:tumor necrosis factor receptor superfamily member 19L isoform X2 [Megalops cyprinoides]|uniref:tumor necrosis factor receptor superfamily member 19L isoform X2 n=1 Tax=Megalops cyprinoides TaxID=118141 RepID=UPI001865633A|nr:tumor necrosis factor receptor superfamily member 19L isoform X2 [Megalops cyprinoides]